VSTHERIASDLRGRIESGELGTAERLPGEEALADGYGVARMTVRHALTSLAEAGYVYRRHGVGTFVADPARRRRSLSGLRSFREEMEEAGRTVSTRLLASAVEPAGADVAAALAIAAGEEVVFLARLRDVDGEPMALQHSWLPAALCPGLEQDAGAADSLYAALEERYGVRPEYADQRIAAVAADAERAAALDVAAGSPLLQIERTARDSRDRAVEVARSWSRPDFELFTHLERR
jgi:GntR family transcriptional regulator